MAKKAEAPAPAAPQEKTIFKSNNSFFKDYWTKNKTWRPWSEEVAAEMAELMTKTNLTPGLSDKQYWAKEAIEAGVKQKRERASGERTEATGTTTKKTGKAISFVTFCERVAETKMALDTLTEAVELVGDCESVSIAKSYLSKWEKLLTLCGGDISKAQEIVAIGL